LAEQPLIEKSFLEKLERLALWWQKSFPGLVGGHSPSRFGGPGQEFLDHRQFHHGDDLRDVNWRAYLRFEKLFMKMFHVEPRIPVRLLLDVSLSMATGDHGKFDYSRRLAAALSYIGQVRLETITILPFDERLDDSFTSTGGRYRFGPTAEFLSQLQPGGTTRFSQVVREFTDRYMQPGLLLVVSDFLDDEGAERPLELLSQLGHELFLIQLWDDVDREPPWSGWLELEDAETGKIEHVEFDRQTRREYAEEFDGYSRTLQRLAMSSGGRYAGLSTSQSLEDAIFGPLSRTGGVH
jgi:uncharacterized protein (DUF58 family)